MFKVHCYKVFECFGLSFTQKGSNQQLRMTRNGQFCDEYTKNFKIEVMKNWYVVIVVEIFFASV